MSKRSRRRKKSEDVRPADHALPVELGRDEPQWVVKGPAFADFDAGIDRELEVLVSRWIHVATPGASGMRRTFRQAARRHSGHQL